MRQRNQDVRQGKGQASRAIQAGQARQTNGQVKARPANRQKGKAWQTGRQSKAKEAGIQVGRVRLGRYTGSCKARQSQSQGLRQVQASRAFSTRQAGRVMPGDKGRDREARETWRHGK